MRVLLIEDDERLADPFEAYPWSGSTRLGHYVYAQRHTMHHQGGLAVLAAVILGAPAAEAGPGWSCTAVSSTGARPRPVSPVPSC